MEQTGIVLELRGDKALVKITRSAACGEQCAACNLCAEKNKKVLVENDAGAAVGNRVTLRMESGGFLLLAFIAYISPIVIAVASNLVLRRFTVQPLTDLLSVGALFLAIALAVPLGRTLTKNKKMQSHIVEILPVEQ